MKTATMYDSINIYQIPLDATRIAAYVNGKYPNMLQAVARFPRAYRFGISVNGLDWQHARIVDFEPGNVQTRDVLRNFVIRRNIYRPKTAVLYCYRAQLDEAEEYLHGLWHVIWLSTLDGTDLTGTRTKQGNLIVGTQVRESEKPLYDVSQVLKSWTYDPGPYPLG